MQLTWLDSNSWLIEIGQCRILLDPWLVGSLVFGKLTWLFEGTKNKTHDIPENIDFILLSQGLEDHAHPPTLEKLDRNLPVIGSPNAGKVCEEFGYQNITTLNHQESYIFDNKLEIKAVEGSVVGMNTVENGYIIKDLATGESLYYEPHGFHSEKLKDQEPVTTIITPLNNIKIPFVGSVIKGQESAVEVCRWLKPQYILSTAEAGDIEYEGILAKLLKADGTIDRFQSLLNKENINTKIIQPEPWQKVDLASVAV